MFGNSFVAGLPVNRIYIGLFKPSTEFSQASYIKSTEEYRHLYDRAQENPKRFWAELADSELQWF